MTRTKTSWLAVSQPGRVLVAVVGLVATALVACGARDSLGDPPDGAEGAHCYPNGTCNVGLSCFSNLCVFVPDAGATRPDASNDSGDSGGGSFESFATSFAEAYCQREIACFGIPAGFLDTQTCIARTTLDMVDALSAPNTGWTTSLLADCTTQAASATCSELWVGMRCLMKPGGRANGSSCGRSSQCASFSCHLDGASTCGTCAPGELADGACAHASECAYPLRCIDAKCVLVGAQDDACDFATGVCGYGLACRSGVCAPAGLGAACSAGVQDCQTNYFCSSGTDSCERDTFALPGQTCGWVNGDASSWVDCLGSPRGCSKTQSDLTGTCPTLTADLGACGSGLGTCVPPATCVGGLCMPPSSALCH